MRFDLLFLDHKAAGGGGYRPEIDIAQRHPANSASCIDEDLPSSWSLCPSRRTNPPQPLRSRDVIRIEIRLSPTVPMQLPLHHSDLSMPERPDRREQEG